MEGCGRGGMRGGAYVAPATSSRSYDTSKWPDHMKFNYMNTITE